MGIEAVTNSSITGGCQCGAVRYSATQLGRATICHCRMCQKAFGSFYGPLVTGLGLLWTRGTPALYASSNKIKRGFCANCGTPLTYDWGGDVEVSIGSLDRPEIAAPILQVNIDDKLPFADGLHDLPVRDLGEKQDASELMSAIKSNQHPDHDTENWPE
ncbi:MAG: GFA family protein [Hyphomicrobiales bacterium]|nr:GFA family protein [Hyphomicrobiales bacterium]